MIQVIILGRAVQLWLGHNMSIKKINQFPTGSGSLTGDDIFLFMDDPSGDAITKKISLSELSSAIGVVSSGGNPFDQSLNTIDQPIFNRLSIESLDKDELVYIQLNPSGIRFSDGSEQNQAGVISNVNNISGASTINNIVKISQTNYDNIVTKDPNTLYVII
jgi:hypothetical protein